MERPPLKNILEAALMAAGSPLSLERMQSLFDDHEQPKSSELKQALTEIRQELLGRGIELLEVASGYRLQVRTEVAPWVARLWEERPQRYSRALLETLALIAYRQPITRGDIEDVRGVVVSSQMMKTLLERDWVRIVGYRDVPGRPAMYATTKEFLDYFGLQSLDDLPSLMEIRELEDANRKLEFGDDAEARKETPKEYQFASEEDVEQRGASVLDATEDDLAAAAALVDRVEANVFARPDADDEGAEPDSKPRDLGELLERLESAEQGRDLSELRVNQPAAGDDAMAQQGSVAEEMSAPEKSDTDVAEGGSIAPEEQAVVEQNTVPDEPGMTREIPPGSADDAQDVPMTLEDAQRARLLAEQQAIKDRILQEIAAEQAALAEADADSDSHGDFRTGDVAADEDEYQQADASFQQLEEEQLRLEAEAEEQLIQQEIEAEKALLAEEALLSEESAQAVPGNTDAGSDQEQDQGQATASERGRDADSDGGNNSGSDGVNDNDGGDDSESSPAGPSLFG